MWKTKRLFGYKGYISDWLAKQPNKNKIRNVRYMGVESAVGVTAIKWVQVVQVTNQSEEDWKKVCSYTSNGINRQGQLFLQKAVESYVYSILGAQVKPKWPIVNKWAKSLQTHVIFNQIVQETIAQSNDSILIKNMRAAIRGTNVAFNMAIIPGVILFPSSLIILDKPIPGYNNVLTMAKKSMTFAVNEDVNFTPIEETTTTTTPVTTTGVAPQPKSKHNPKKGQILWTKKSWPKTRRSHKR